MELDALKKIAAGRAVEEIRSGMTVGLGTGSTAKHAVDALGGKLRSGELTDIVAIPTSSRTAELASQWGIPLVTFATHPVLDLTIDGADEIAPNIDVTKGLGGALLWEKIVATASKRMIIIGDNTKLVNGLGEISPIPVEVVPFAIDVVIPYLADLGCRPVLRMKNDEAYYTDEKNYIVDCHFDKIDDTARLAEQLISCPGVVEHGMFLGIAAEAYVADGEGVTHLTRA